MSAALQSIKHDSAGLQRDKTRRILGGGTTKASVASSRLDRGTEAQLQIFFFFLESHTDGHLDNGCKFMQFASSAKLDNFARSAKLHN